MQHALQFLCSMRVMHSWWISLWDLWNVRHKTQFPGGSKDLKLIIHSRQSLHDPSTRFSLSFVVCQNTFSSSYDAFFSPKRTWQFHQSELGQHRGWRRSQFSTVQRLCVDVLHAIWLRQVCTANIPLLLRANRSNLLQHHALLSICIFAEQIDTDDSSDESAAEWRKVGAARW